MPRLSSFRLSSSCIWAALTTSPSSERIAVPSIFCWLIGSRWPLILMCIGDPTDMNRSDAFLSFINWNSRSIAIVLSSVESAARAGFPQQFVDAGLGARLGIDALDDHRAVQAVLAVGRRQ